MKPDDMVAGNEAAREFELLVSALRDGCKTDREFFTLMRYMAGCESNEGMLDTLLDAREASRQPAPRTPGE